MCGCAKVDEFTVEIPLTFLDLVQPEPIRNLIVEYLGDYDSI